MSASALILMLSMKSMLAGSLKVVGSLCAPMKEWMLIPSILKGLNCMGGDLSSSSSGSSFVFASERRGDS